MIEQKKFQYQKDHAAMKNYLLGRGYNVALRAMAFGAKFHVGYRKDGMTPEYHHQIRIAFSILNLRDVKNEETCLALAFLHDVAEDYDITHDVLNREFGLEIADKTCILDKGRHYDNVKYFIAIENDIDCSIVKGADNGDNIQSMIGAFTKEKMQSYMTRTKDEILPCLKNAANNFPEQSFAYSSIRLRLKDQLALYEKICGV